MQKLRQDAKTLIVCPLRTTIYGVDLDVTSSGATKLMRDM
jgi:hypothetical protein